MVNLLFDYDGTLHNSLQIYAPAVQAAYDRLVELGYAEPRSWPAEVLQQWIGLSPDEMWDRFQPHLPQAEREASIALVGQRMQELLLAGRAELYPGIPEVLETLCSQGYRLLLLSTCPQAYLDAHRKQFSLERYFSGLYCGEAFGYQPKHEICRRLMEQYDGDFVAIGDRRTDMEIGLQNRFPAIGCLYGFGTTGELAEAALTVQTPLQLPEAVAKLF